LEFFSGCKTMELVTTAFKIAIDERSREIKEKNTQIQQIIDEFRIKGYKATTLLEYYHIFSQIIVEYWDTLGEEIAGRIFDLLFREWELMSRIVIPVNLKNDYYYCPEEDF